MTIDHDAGPTGVTPDDLTRRAPAVFLGAPAGRAAGVLATLRAWVARGWLREIDRAFAAFLAARAPDADPLLVLAAALASHQLGRGHSCLDLGDTLRDASTALALPPPADADERGDVHDRPPEAPAADGPPPRAALPADTPPPSPGHLLLGVDLDRWRAALAHPGLVGTGDGTTPLVRVGDRLYLRRYWAHERAVRAAIEARLAAAPDAHDAPGGRPGAAGVAPALDDVPVAATLRRALDTLFPGRDGAPADWQRIACALAARSRFAIVTGGPGTGKTTTVVRLLALLQQLALDDPSRPPRPLRIRLAAPTGKAAARLHESISGAVAGLPVDALVATSVGRSTPPAAEAAAGEAGAHLAARAHALREAIPTEVSTVHRLLGSRPGTRRFLHDALRPLAVDVVVVDEASMLDLATMASLVAALPPSARLVLLGDKDQLASVEAGSVLGDLCRRADGGHYTPATARWIADATGEAVDEALVDPDGTPLDQAIAMLRHSHRFSAASGIGRLARAVNAGDPEAVRAVRDGDAPDLARVAADDDAAFRQLVLHGAADAFPAAGRGRTDARGDPVAPPVGHGHFLSVVREARPPVDADRGAFDAWAASVLEAFGRFQLLAALRRGPQGVEGLNRRVEAVLREAGWLDAAPGGWPIGRPVLVTANDYGLGLMNGDVGVTLALPVAPAWAAGGTAGAGEPGRLAWTPRVAFPGVARPAGAAGDDDADAPPGVRWFVPSRLRDVETAFAMTVHKSQGSEFAHAALVLPDRPNPVLTRELLYTGITRAKDWFSWVGPAGDAGDAVLDAAVRARVQRVGGLLDG